MLRYVNNIKRHRAKHDGYKWALNSKLTDGVMAFVDFADVMGFRLVYSDQKHAKTTAVPFNL